LQSDLQPAQVEKGCPRQRVNEDVEIALIGISAVQHGSEHPRIAGTILLDELPNLVAVKLQGPGRFHAS
jgi:hypothetical protein